MRSENSMVKWLRALGQSGTARVHLALIFFEAQLEELEKRVDGGEKIPQAADLAKRAVERFDGFGDVDDFADLRGKVEEGGELAPVGLPAAADGEVLGIVGGAEGFKRAPGGLFGGGAVPACVGEVSGSGRVGLCGSGVRGEESPWRGTLTRSRRCGRHSGRFSR